MAQAVAWCLLLVLVVSWTVAVIDSRPFRFMARRLYTQLFADPNEGDPETFLNHLRDHEFRKSSSTSDMGKKEPRGERRRHVQERPPRRYKNHSGYGTD